MGDELVVTVISLACDITCFGELGQGTRESFVLSLLSLYLHVTCLVLIGENCGHRDGARPRVSLSTSSILALPLAGGACGGLVQPWCQLTTISNSPS